MSFTDFDPESFMSGTTDEASADHFDPIPEGEYSGVITKVEVNQFQGSKDPSKTFTTLNVTWSIDDAALAERLGRAELTSRQSVFLDINDAGNLATGPNVNVGLGKLRDAVNQNQAGQPWSPTMLEGAGPALVKVEHRITDDGTFDQVNRVAKAA